MSIVDIARVESDAHVVESPAGSNRVKFWDWWYDQPNFLAGPAFSWCAVFVSWCAEMAGTPLPAVNTNRGFSYCPDGVAYAVRNGESVSEPRPGDVIIYSWYDWYPDDGLPRVTTTAANAAGHPEWAGMVAGDHTGIFVGWNGAIGGSFTAIEGNTARAGFSQDDGGAVLERSDRNAGQVCCWWRPKSFGSVPNVVLPASALPTLSLSVGSLGSAVRLVQAFLASEASILNNPALNPGAPDGEYGPATASAVAAWQAVIFPASAAEWDGEWGPRTARASEVFLAGPIVPPIPQPDTPNPPVPAPSPKPVPLPVPTVPVPLPVPLPTPVKRQLRLIATDVSDYQSAADWAVLAAAADGVWAKWADWVWWVDHGVGESTHLTIIQTAKDAGKPAGSYLFCRPDMSDPELQVDTWADHCPELTMSAMLDLEADNSLSGPVLTDWVNRALVRMAQRFGRLPVLYWSRKYAVEHGMGPITAPHVNMVAEYHLGYQPMYWADRAGWEARAYAPYGGPDLPPGEETIDVWQFTSSAQMPGYAGPLDASFVTDLAWELVVSPDAPAPLTLEEALVADERFDRLMSIVNALPGMIDKGTVTGHYRPARVGTAPDSTEPLYAGLYVGRPPIVFDWSMNGEAVKTPCVAYDFTWLPVGATIHVHPIEPGVPDATSGIWTSLCNKFRQVFAATWWGDHATYTTTELGFHTVVHPANRPCRIEVTLP